MARQPTTAAFGKAMLPDSLVRDFGGNTDCARQLTGSLAAALRRALDDERSDAVGHAFAQWQMLFGEVTGYEARGLNERPEIRRFARSLGLEEPIDPPRLFFVVHTYFALLIKLIAYCVVSRFAAARPDRFASLGRAGADELQRELTELEQGAVFRTLGVGKFLEADCFSWYLHAWDADVARAIASVCERLSDYDPSSLAASPEPARDLFKSLYQRLMPRPIRHDLGEYYTPDWLAELVLNELGYDGEPDHRLLDPACGSGTFLVLAIGRLRERCRRDGLNERETLDCILRNVVGIDLNPLAVVAARTNYLLALGDLLAHRSGDIEIPVYLADSILPPPALAGMFGQFDLVAGNPPWIGWESLPEEYRVRTKPLWQRHGLFPHGGMDTILGKGKKDLSMLMSCCVTERFLRPGGRLGFLITQSVFKTSGAGEGFRRFRIGEDDADAVRVIAVHDLSDFQPFESASTRTCAFVWEKGVPTRFPVPYTVWQKTAQRRSIREDATLAEAMSMTRRLEFVAEPIVPESAASAWLTARPPAIAAIRRLVGRSAYEAHEGVNSGGNNAVYWVEVVGERPDGVLVVRNLTDGAKRQVAAVRDVELEPDLVYPLLRGREVRRWNADRTAHIILAQDVTTRRGLDERLMREKYGRTYRYLQRFESDLRGRAAFKRYFTRGGAGRTAESAPFYSMFDVGEYTLSPWKVVWHRMVTPIGAVVVGCVAGKPVLPQETHAFVAVGSQPEAFYLAGILNSLPFNFAARAYSQAGGKSFGSPHLLEHLHVPRFQSADGQHRRIAEIAQAIQTDFHKLNSADFVAREAVLDEAVAPLWNISADALAEMQASMAVLTKTDLR